MPIPELIKFREKFPQYNDMDDATIANRLAEKYPDAYGDLPGKLQSAQPQQEVLPEQGTVPQQSIPQMLGRNLLDAAQQTYSETISPVLSGLNTAAFGLPKAMIPEQYRKMIFPEQQTMTGKAMRIAAEIPAYLYGGASKVATKVAGAIPRIAGKGLLKAAARGAAGGAAYGATQSMPGDEGLELGQRPGRALGGAALGGVFGGLADAVKVGARWLKPQNQLKLAEDARNSLFTQKQQTIENFGKQYDRIIQSSKDKTITLNEAYKGLMENTDDALNSFSSVDEFNKALAANNPTAKKLMNLVKSINENPAVPVKVSVKEADAIQKFIRQMPGIKGKIERGYKFGQQNVDWTNSERIMLDFAADIKSSILDTAPELKALNRSYGQFMNNYKQIRPYLKWNSAVTNFKNIHRLDPAILDKMQQTIPKNILGDIMQLNRVNRNAELLKRIAPYAVAGTGGYVLREVTRK